MPIGVTTKFEHESGSSWVEVYKTRSVNYPGYNTSSVDNTSLANDDFAMTYEPGMIDANVITFESEWSEASYATLQGIVSDREAIGWRVSGPDGSDPLTCDGFLTKLDVNITPGELMIISGEVKLTGLPVLG